MQRKKIKPNVLLVLDFLEPGGATRLNQELTHIINDSNFIVLAGMVPEITIRHTNLEKEFNATKLITYEIRTNSSFVLYLINILRTFHLSFAIFRKYKIDKVILNLPHSGIGLLLNPFSWRVKRIYIFHGSWDLEKRSLRIKKQKMTIFFDTFSELYFKMKNKIDYLFTKILLSTTNKVIVFSKYSADLVNNHYKINANKIVQIIPPVLFKKKVPKFRITDYTFLKKTYGLMNTNKIVFLVPSRLEPRKGIHLLIEAVYLLQLEGFDNFIILITGPEFDTNFSIQLFRRCRELGLLHLILFLPSQSRENLSVLYRVVDCTIMPSIDLETFGLVTMESLKFGKPVIGLPSGATPEILMGINQRLIAENSTPTGLKNTIKWFLQLDKPYKKVLEGKCTQYYCNTYSDNYVKNLSIALFE